MKTNRVGTSTNLAPGGTYDMLLIRFEGTYPEGKVSFGLYDTPMKITGVQKVAQTFMKTLMTSKGSDPFYPNRGTDFPNLTIGANQTISDTAYMALIKNSVADAEAQVKSGLNIQNPDPSSCLASAQVLGMDKFDDSLVLYVQVTTLSGITASVAMPFPEFGLTK